MSVSTNIFIFTFILISANLLFLSWYSHILSYRISTATTQSYQHENEHYQQVASDCIWSDPASDDQEKSSVDPESGYGESLRGGGAICFGHKAVKDFLEQHNFSYIMVRFELSCTVTGFGVSGFRGMLLIDSHFVFQWI